MKVFRNKKTGRLGETQFNDNADVLIKNAKACGKTDEEIEIIDMSLTEYMAAIKAQNIEDEPIEKRTERKIQAEIKRLCDLTYRDQAILNLEQAGEI